MDTILKATPLEDFKIDFMYSDTRDISEYKRIKNVINCIETSSSTSQIHVIRYSY